MNKLNIYKFKDGDETYLLPIIFGCLREVNSKDLSREELENKISLFSPELIKKYSQEENTTTFVGKADGVIVGTVTVTKNRIRSFFVDTKMHRLGIGKTLLTHAEKEIQKNGYPDAFLGSSIYAIPFYERHGYVISGELNDPKVGRMVKMQKNF